MNEDIEELTKVLKLKGYSYKTIKVYRCNVGRFLLSGFEQTTTGINNYILGLIDSKRYKETTINQIINSINFYFKHVVRCSETCKVGFLKKRRSLPEVLGISEVKRIISSIKNLKHKMIFTLIYSSGLRVGEVVVLKPDDIDIDRELIHIKRAKGKKDRYTLLSNTAKELFEFYLKKEKPTNYLFPGSKYNSHLSIRSVQAIMNRKVHELNIKKKCNSTLPSPLLCNPSSRTGDRYKIYPGVTWS